MSGFHPRVGSGVSGGAGGTVRLLPGLWPLPSLPWVPEQVGRLTAYHPLEQARGDTGPSWDWAWLGEVPVAFSAGEAKEGWVLAPSIPATHKISFCQCPHVSLW